MTMKAKNVVLGEVYAVKVSGKVVGVRMFRESPHGGWQGISCETGRDVRIRTAAKLRRNLTIEQLFKADGDLHRLGRPLKSGDLDGQVIPALRSNS